MRTNFLDPSSARQGHLEIADHTEAVAGFRSFLSQANGTQRDNPEDLSALIVAEPSSSPPARRILFGEDVHDWAGVKCTQLEAEIDVSRARD